MRLPFINEACGMRKKINRRLTLSPIFEFTCTVHTIALSSHTHTPHIDIPSSVFFFPISPTLNLLLLLFSFPLSRIHTHTAYEQRAYIQRMNGLRVVKNRERKQRPLFVSLMSQSIHLISITLGLMHTFVSCNSNNKQ